MFSFIPTFINPKSKRASFNARRVDTRSPEQCMADYIMDRDKASIERLYSLFADDMYHYLITLSDSTLAQDIAQQTWTKVIDRPQAFHQAQNLKAWLFTLARNALFDEFKKTNRLQAIDDELDNAELVGIQSLNAHNDNIQEAFDTALNALPFNQKEAFCLQQEGFSLADIANMTNCPQETIKTRLRYAKQKLKQLLEPVND